MSSLVTEVARFLARGLQMLTALGASGAIRIEVGAVGLDGSQWAGQFDYERSDALRNRVRFSEARRTWNTESIVDFLVTLTARFGEAYGRPGIDATTIQRMIADNLGPKAPEIKRGGCRVMIE